MKRYWKILTLCLVTVIVLGTFYIQSSLAADNIRIDFEKVSGDESLVENLVFTADYVVGDIHQTLLISNEETTSLSNRSVVQQMTGFYVGASTNDLVEKYKQFMRGKNYYPPYFYEDEHVLVYVGVEGRSISNSSISSNSYFDIDVLDKKSEESTPTRLNFPKNGTYNWVDIVDVQIVDGNLKVIARGSGIDRGDNLLVYTIDLNSKKITNDEVIFSTPKVKNGWSDFRFFNDDHSNKPEKYLFFKAEAREYGEGDGEPAVIADDYMVYDIAKNKTVKIEFPDDFVGSIENSSILDSVIYVPVQSVNEVEIIQYDIEAAKWDKKQTFAVAQSKDAEHEPFVKLLDGKIYIISATDDGHTLSIGDINTGETLYEGKLKVKNQKTDQKEYQLYIHGINVEG